MKTILSHLAALRLTAAGFVLLAIGLVMHHQESWTAPWSIVIPLSLLSLNLVSALIVDPRFRSKPALFGFHVCLLMVAGIAAWGQLSSLHGRIAAIEGLGFDPEAVEIQAQGPWAPSHLALAGIRQGAFRVDYAASLDRRSTHSELHSSDGGWFIIGDDVPLNHRGFRIYTTSNKGFAVILNWMPVDGSAQLGSILFPSFPARQLMQRTDWRTPAGQRLSFRLDAPPVPFDRSWTLGSAMIADVGLSMHTGDGVQALRPGESVAVEGGSIRFERVALWMGYRVTYIPGLPWLFSSALLGIVLMAVHIHSSLRRGSRQPVSMEMAGGDACR